jgi:ribosome biogenesis protein Nip4
MQIKSTLRFHLTSSKWQPLRKQITNAVKDADKKELLYTVDGKTSATTMEISTEVPQKIKNRSTF